MVDTSTAECRRELDHRVSAGVSVTLIWRQLDDRLTITVHDLRTGELLEFEPAPHEAREAFEHPYAYAPASA